MTNFYLVESPLQLINAVEARYLLSNSKDSNELIILEGVSSQNLEQVTALVKESDWGKVHVLSNTKNRWRYLSPRKALDAILAKTTKIGTVCIGEYRSILMRHFIHKSKPVRACLLDDGNYSLLIQREILKGNGVRRSYNFIRRMYDFLVSLQDGDLLEIEFFSVYTKNMNIENGNRFIRNTYDILKGGLKEKGQGEEVLFVGNNTPEMKIFSEEYYLNLLRGVKNYYSGREIFYIPHRREDVDKLRKIKQSLDFEILVLNKPIEISLVQRDKLPYRVASFFSSALDNCYFIFGKNIHLDAFKVEKNKIMRDDYFERIALNYQAYNEYDSDTFEVIGTDMYLRK